MFKLIAVTMLALPGLALAAPTAPVPDAVPPAGVIATPVAKAKNDVVCRSSVETGSLIARHKTCQTRKQWVKTDDQTQEDARRFVEDNRWKPQ